MGISIICVYNNEKQFNEQLKFSLSKQKVEYELIAIDNRENKFKSASAALNYGATQASGDILIFSHQDIYFKTQNELENLAKAIQSSNIGDIVGIVGVTEKNKKYCDNLTCGIKYNSDILNNFKLKLYQVSCVDECLFGMMRETWEQHNFDEKLCDNWHLYSVESCLNARKNANKVYVFPAQIHHFSKGTISLGYMKNLKLLCKVYRKDFKYIWTTCYKVKTNPLYINGLLILWVINRFVRGNLK